MQEAGEHALCGDGLINDEFSYSPDEFMRANSMYPFITYMAYDTRHLSSPIESINTFASILLPLRLERYDRPVI